MSWNFQAVGSRTAVKAAVQVAFMPENVKAAIIEVCDDPKPIKSGIIVKGFGHNNDGKSHESSIGSLVVEPIDLAKEP